MFKKWNGGQSKNWKPQGLNKFLTVPGRYCNLNPIRKTKSKGWGHEKGNDVEKCDYSISAGIVSDGLRIGGEVFHNQ